MKFRHYSHGRVVLFVAGGLGALVPMLSGASSPPDAPRPPATHTLYLGADVEIEWKGQLRPVQGVQGNAFIVGVDGKRAIVREDDPNLRIKIDDNLKMARSVATVANLQADRAYTPERDPREKFSRMVGMTMGAAAQSDVDSRQMRWAQARESYMIATQSGGSDLASVQEEARSAEANYARSVDQAGMAINSVGNHSAEMEAELMREEYDALRITFDLSSPRPLTEAYLVVTARYRENPDKPKTLRMLIYAQALPEIDQSPTSVRLFRGGFPPGFELESYQIHLYDKGTEIATTAARKQVPLTAEEAFQYALSDHLAKNRDKTLAPVPAREFWPEDLRVKSAAGRSDTVLYVKVDKDGRPVGAYSDDACTQRVQDEGIVAAVGTLRFYPALNKGKLVEGVASLKFGQLGR